MSHLAKFPADLPVPIDDGSCSHLIGLRIPPQINLPISFPAAMDGIATKVENISIAETSDTNTVIVFFYPRTASPKELVPKEWDAIPGARGCTPQNCSFRDAHSSIVAAAPQSDSVKLFGCSAQSPDVHAELSNRLGLTYPLLSDEDLTLARALQLPTFEWDGNAVIKRLTIVVEKREIVMVWYPIFPPDSNAVHVEDWLVKRSAKVIKTIDNQEAQDSEVLY